MARGTPARPTQTKAAARPVAARAAAPGSETPAALVLRQESGGRCNGRAAKLHPRFDPFRSSLKGVQVATLPTTFGHMPPACPVVAHARRYRPASLRLARCHRLARWSLTLAATRRPLSAARCPPACPVVAHVRRYPPASFASPDATGLPGGGSRSPLPAGLPPRPMPPACPVVAHVRRYPPASLLAPDATGLPGGDSRSPLPAGSHRRARCHRLARWSLTLAATRRPPTAAPNATGLPGGGSRSPLPAGPLRCARCHRLARWSLTFAATRRPPALAERGTHAEQTSDASQTK